jgi:hypothetical protein
MCNVVRIVVVFFIDLPATSICLFLALDKPLHPCHNHLSLPAPLEKREGVQFDQMMMLEK